MSRRASSLSVLLTLALVAFGPRARAFTNGVALTPPMGFNSWYSYGASVDEALIKYMADTMATNGMLAAGYNYINLDDGWAGYRDTNGVMVADTNKFPDGMQAVVNYVHAKGFKIGLYTAASTNTCADYPGSINHIVQDANTYAAWGIDYLKYEGCNVSTYEIYPRGQIYCARMSQALLHCGRPIVFSFSIGGAFENWMPQYINLWRGTGDINGNWSTILSHIDFVALTPSAAGPGGWNDPDVLEVGSGFLSDDESKSQFSMYCMLASPLLVLANETTQTNIVCNPEAIAVDQDPAGIQGLCVASNNNLQVWRRPLGGSNSSTIAVALFNRGSNAANITANWSDLGLPSGVVAVWDMWAHAYAGNFTNSYTANIPLHGIQLLKIIKGATMPLPPTGTDYVSGLPWLANVSNVTTFPNNYPFSKDLSGASTTMSLHGTNYTNGLGMNGYTRISYFLGGTATQFQSTIGMDDYSGGVGSMIFSIYGDGTLLYQSGALTSRSNAQTLNLNIAGYNDLTLQVASAIPGTADDFADWANARITFVALPPMTPGGLNATPTASQFAVSWYAVSGATDYILERATVSGGPYTPIVTNAAASYTDTNVTAGVTYYYVVSAINANGPSTNSAQIDATLPAYWANTQTGAAQSWNVNANWTNTSAFPNRAGALAIVSSAITSSQTINLNQGITLASLVLGVTNGSAAFNLAANGGTLAFNNGNSPATLTDLATAAGDSLSAPITLAGNLAIATLSTNFLTLSGAVSGPGSLTANGPGPLLLSGSNSFNGPVSINAGLLQLGNASALGVTNGTLNIARSATLDVNGFNLGAESVTVAGAGFDGNGAIISSAAAPQTNALNSLTLAGNTVLGGAGRWDVRGASNFTASGVLGTGGNAFALTKTGSNEISLASLTVDAALGDIDIDEGTLSFENATTSLGSPANALNVQMGATLAFTQTTNVWNKNFALSGNGTIPTIASSGSNTLIGPITVSGTCLINVTNGVLALNGPLGGNANLVKDLAGTLSLGGTNSGGITGALTVNAGTLAIQNATALSTVTQLTVVEGAELDVSALNGGLTLGANQVLSGGGVVNGSLAIGNQATLAPDASFGVPTFNNTLTFSSGSTCVLDVIAESPFFSDELRVAGNLNFAGTLIVSNLAGNPLAACDSFQLFSAASYSGAFSAILPQLPGTNLIWDTSQLGVNGTLSIVSGTLPRFTSSGIQGGKIVFSGSGGSNNAPYYLLTATNLALPVAQWTRIATNSFNSQGGFTITLSNISTTNIGAVYYRLQTPAF